MSRHFPQTFPDGGALPVREGVHLKEGWRYRVGEDGSLYLGVFNDAPGSQLIAEVALTPEEAGEISQALVPETPEPGPEPAAS